MGEPGLPVAETVKKRSVIEGYHIPYAHQSPDENHRLLKADHSPNRLLEVDHHEHHHLIKGHDRTAIYFMDKMWTTINYRYTNGTKIYSRK